MESSEVYTFVIDERHAGLRTDRVLSLLCEDVSRSYIQKLIEGGNMRVDGVLCTSKKLMLKEGQTVGLTFPGSEPCGAVPEDLDLDIVFEDKDILVVNKPKGMVVHPAAGNLSGTLVNGLLAHCGSLSVINGTERPGIVHRIDKDTSGLLVVAKTDAAHRGLSAQFAEHTITRIYRGVCFFTLAEDSFTIDAPIGRDSKNRLRNAVVPGGKRAVTHIKTINRFNGFTEFEARLETGRTHQIRVHMAYKNRPLLGDELYGPAKQPYKTNGQMLHAGTLGFIHPCSGQYMEFSVQPPEEYLDVIDKIKARS